jgi:predicted phosphodiesterase
LRFAVFSDLHVGATTAKSWHNRFLTDQPEETVTATVAAVNAERPDFVVITGDLADLGTDGELERARAALDGLAVPWIVCPGNHDSTESGDRSAFERVFGERAPEGIVPADLLPLPDGVRAVSFAARWHEEGGQWRVYLSDDAVQSAVNMLDGQRPRLLLIFCHFPFVRQSDFVREQAGGTGRNAGTLWDGEAALDTLAALADFTIAFTGHQHFHHIARGDNWLHVTTAALVEYPAEYRLVTIGPDGPRITTACGVPGLIDANPPEVTWVRGRADDRSVMGNA